MFLFSLVGSGVETPTSEPGVSLTDMWDCDWEDEPEDRFIYRHQVSLEVTREANLRQKLSCGHFHSVTLINAARLKDSLCQNFSCGHQPQDV